MRMSWLPWRYVLRRVARRHGFIDPVHMLSTMHGFAHPSEVAVPVELLRAGVVFHARGLINTKAIQTNLDWVWPYWVVEQFNPLSESFLPRAFSVTHVNLTHRNWTAVGLPDCESLPIVDPRGLVTPLYDGWSLDGWVMTDAGEELLPSHAAEAEQRLVMTSDDFAVRTAIRHNNLALETTVRMTLEDDRPVCEIRYEADAPPDSWLVVALRPCNPEGISFIHEVTQAPDGAGWTVNRNRPVHFERPMDKMEASNYHDGDVYADFTKRSEETAASCNVGLATASALYRIGGERHNGVTVRVPVDLIEEHIGSHVPIKRPVPWQEALAPACKAELPTLRLQYLYDAAIRALILHTPGEVYPGPYTYKRFWFRDTAFMVNALLALGFLDRVRRVLDTFPSRQRVNGFFHSQDGEWDSNGEALWIMERYCRYTGTTPPEAWRKPIEKGADWIVRKRTSDKLKKPHAGLFPAGFSAEHLGNNDYYYWDDFWGVAGLHAAGDLAALCGNMRRRKKRQAQADKFMAAIERSLERTGPHRRVDAVPASPYRRMDAGAVGSVVVGYPLQLWDAREPRLINTVDWLLENSSVHGAFFQDMIHSGINAYLTLHLAQVLLRAEDLRWYDLMMSVADLASPTGQWPEAIHPRTGGGCMGDGQHAWAAAEWALFVRNLFVREEGDHLVIGAGIHPEWRKLGKAMSLGPTPTPWGPVTVHIEPRDEDVRVTWEADWRSEPPVIHVALPELPRRYVEPGEGGDVTVECATDSEREFATSD